MQLERMCCQCCCFLSLTYICYITPLCRPRLTWEGGEPHLQPAALCAAIMT